jgi:hypothetical protein
MSSLSEGAATLERSHLQISSLAAKNCRGQTNRQALTHAAMQSEWEPFAREEVRAAVIEASAKVMNSNGRFIPRH